MYICTYVHIRGKHNGNFCLCFFRAIYILTSSSEGFLYHPRAYFDFLFFFFSSFVFYRKLNITFACILNLSGVFFFRENVIAFISFCVAFIYCLIIFYRYFSYKGKQIKKKQVIQKHKNVFYKVV